jgi:hypothetical protein
VTTRLFVERALVSGSRALTRADRAIRGFIRVNVSTDATATNAAVSVVWTRCPSDRTNRHVHGIIGASL